MRTSPVEVFFPQRRPWSTDNPSPRAKTGLGRKPRKDSSSRAIIDEAAHAQARPLRGGPPPSSPQLQMRQDGLQEEDDMPPPATTTSTKIPAPTNAAAPASSPALSPTRTRTRRASLNTPHAPASHAGKSAGSSTMGTAPAPLTYTFFSEMTPLDFAGPSSPSPPTPLPQPSSLAHVNANHNPSTVPSSLLHVSVSSPPASDSPSTPLEEFVCPTYSHVEANTSQTHAQSSVPVAGPSSQTFPSASTSTLKVFPSVPPPGASTSSGGRTHSKRRDPSYIPRPPNAFILFRSAFIREQNVPGKVEGNHSKLSKIIGLCWKQLPAEEREKWEARAVVAQAEHRAQYPDWRFRPGANALAKLNKNSANTSSVDGGSASARGSGGGSSRRRNSVRQTRTKEKDQGAAAEANGDEDGEVDADREGDGDGGDYAPSNAKGKGRAKDTKVKSKPKSSQMQSLEETRCAKIAGFVAEGIRGKELEAAVEQWEGDRKVPLKLSAKESARNSKSTKTRSRANHARSRSGIAISSPIAVAPPPPSTRPITPRKRPPSPAVPSSDSSGTTPTHTNPHPIARPPPTMLTPVTLETSISRPGASERIPNSNITSGSPLATTPTSLLHSPVSNSPSHSHSHSQPNSQPPQSANPHIITTPHQSPTINSNQSVNHDANLQRNAHPMQGLSSGVPLTHMFKRSSSAPAPNKRPRLAHTYQSQPDDSSTPPTSTPSSGDGFSPPSAAAEPSPGTWGTFEPPMSHETHSGHTRANSQTHMSPHAQHGHGGPGHAHIRGGSIAAFAPHPHSPSQSTMASSATSHVTSPFGTPHLHAQPPAPPTPSHHHRPQPQHQQRHQLAWAETEQQRRLGLEEMDVDEQSNQTHPQPPSTTTADSWWSSSRSSSLDAQNHWGEGYEAGETQFDRAYIQQYGAFDSPQDGTQQVEWGDLSASSTTGKQGLVTVIEDPYKEDDCGTNCGANDPNASVALAAETEVVSPPTLNLPPLSAASGSFYYSSIPPVSPPSLSPINPAVPSSNFSTLTGWDGDNDYKFYSHYSPQPLSSSMRAWHETSGGHAQISHHDPLPPSPMPPRMLASPSSPSPWFATHTDSAMVWGSDPAQGAIQRPQLHHPGLPSATDWDRLEYRAATEMGLAVGPNPVPRVLSFQEELRRMHGGA